MQCASTEGGGEAIGPLWLMKIPWCQGLLSWQYIVDGSEHSSRLLEEYHCTNKQLNNFGRIFSLRD